MDDVDYLVEVNARDDFAYHRKWMGPTVGPLLKMILDNNCRGGQPMGIWHNGGASWEQNSTVGNVPTIISARDPDPIGDRIPQTQHVQKESLQHKLTR